MAGGRTQKNKAHKTRFASKSSRNAHKLSSGDKVAGKGAARVPPPGQAAREIRHQRNKNIREQKRAGVLAEKRASSSPTSAPRILALVGLSAKVNVEALKERILAVCHTAEVNGTIGQNGDAMDTESTIVRENKEPGAITVAVPRFKLRLTIIEAPRDDLQACLEVAKVADIVAFVGHVVPDEGGYIDPSGRKCLSMLRSLGLPVTTGLLVGLADVAAKKKSDVKKGALAALETELLEDTKMHVADSTDECQQVLRHLAEQRLSNPTWRAQRPYLVAQQLEYEADPNSSGTGILRVSGYVRSRAISVNQLVHLAGVGDFQLKQIDMVEDPCPLRQQKRQNVNGDSMQVEDVSAGQKASTSVVANPALQEALIVENIPDDLAGEQTWPTEEELAQAGKAKRRKKKRVLPRGTSEYQAAWIVEDSDQEEGDADDDDDADDDMEGAGLDAQAMDDDREGSVISEDDRATSVWDGDDTRSEMMDEEDLTPEQRKSEIERLKAAHAADEEFPDEVDTPSDIPARQRFAKYRGLKSLRTSPWDPKESLPFEYAKIFAFDNFPRTQKSVLSKVKEIDSGIQEGSFATGCFVRLHILQVPASKVEPLLKSYKTNPVVVCGLLQHETKMSVLHYSVKKSESYTDPIKSKELLIFHTGFRRHHTRPIFSTDDLNMDKHKFERFLHPGRFSIASIFAPISFPTLPLIVFKETDEGATVVANGSLRSVDPDRVILKKIVLSGYPLRVQKRKAVVRFMFHNPEDVRWFRPLELWTKYGRRGRIKEPVGTHGSMKCVFDGVVQQRDAVCINLYKRVYPKWPQHLLTE
ncbi:hypothetical protein M758_2G227700 [Ceratodon purpureus]|nr:hypothetical protein M758_2G227700 [Ceratodon purpureus]